MDSIGIYSAMFQAAALARLQPEALFVDSFLLPISIDVSQSRFDIRKFDHATCQNDATSCLEARAESALLGSSSTRLCKYLKTLQEKSELNNDLTLSLVC